mgnify:CR=1 FL=1
MEVLREVKFVGKKSWGPRRDQIGTKTMDVLKLVNDLVTNEVKVCQKWYYMTTNQVRLTQSK